MTKEELEKEAEEFTDTKKSFWRQGRTCIGSVKQAYIAGAEPREKRIEELFALVQAERKRQEQCNDIHLRKIAELEKENAELKNRDCWKSCEYANPKSELIVQHIQDVQKLTKVKELLAKWVELYKPKSNTALPTPIQVDTEQFLKEVSE